MVPVGQRPLVLFIFPVVLCSLIAYWGVWNFGLVNYDDNVYLTSQIASGISLRNIVWSFNTLYFANWHPLTWISYMLDASLFKRHFGLYHFENLLLHILASSLVLIFIHRLTQDMARSTVIALLFAVHPLHLQSVAWVAERKDVLSAVFGMWMLIDYLDYSKAPTLRGYLKLVALFSLGLMAKTMLVTVPVILLLLDYIFLTRKAWCEKVPLFLMSAAVSFASYAAQHKWGSMNLQAPPMVSLANAFVSYLRYIGKFIWPTNLALFYPFPAEIPWYWTVASVFALAGLSVLAYQAGKEVLFGWAWFVVSLLPVIGIVKVGLQAIADRYMYLPSIGLLMVITWSIKDKRWASAMGIAGALVCIAITRHNLPFWSRSIATWRHAIEANGL